ERQADPLMRELLKELDLSGPDKDLLQQVTSKARLRHPVMGVLSPGLLDWTYRLYLRETARPEAPQIRRRLWRISEILYDHTPPTVEAGGTVETKSPPPASRKPSVGQP
ncbi:MAG: hypothetical protein JW810_11095, partial [Sedimentisphaerales bacterium]|nr:hypothetical protein [Sedimentisphaerales bacterium]